MINDETKENLYKRELIGELINELRNAVLTGDTIYLLDKFVASLNMHEQQKQRADELEKNLNLINSSQDNLVNELQQALNESNERADELENTLADIKSHLNNLWHNGDATEHEYAYNTLKYIESLQEDDND